MELFFSVILGISNYTKAFSTRLHDLYKLSKMKKKRRREEEEKEEIKAFGTFEYAHIFK